MKRWKLTTCVYVALGALTVLTIAIAVWRWDDPWARDWLPNFIAEWSGLFIAVAIVDRLLSRERAEQEAARREPLRRLAGTQLGSALETVIGMAVQDYGSRDDSLEEPPEPAATFFGRWAATIADSPDARDAGWVYILSHSFRASAEALISFRAQYQAALEPAELVRVDALTNRLKADAEDLRLWGEDIDSSVLRRGIRERIPPFTPEEVAHNVGNRCVRLVPDFAAVVADYEGLTGAQLTTQAAWLSVNLSRAWVELFVKREATTDS